MPPGPPPDTEEPPDPHEACRDASIPVRDLLDGSAIPRFKVRLGSRELEADDAGALQLPGDGRGDLVAADPVWTLAPPSVERALREGALWAHRPFRVRGRVTGSDAPLNKGVEIEVAHDKKGAEAPWTAEWLRAHEVFPWAYEDANADGTFEIELPRIRGLLLEASAPGRRPAWTPLAVDRTTEVVDVDLVLPPAFRIRGRVTDAQGRPVSGALVEAYVAGRETPGDDDFYIESWESGGHAVRKWRSETGDVLAAFGAHTDREGRFEIEVDLEGEGLLCVKRAGHAAFHRLLGAIRGDVGPVDVALERGSGGRIRVLRKGVPAEETSIYISDLEFPEPRPAFELHTDADGYLPAEWLVAGHRYAVTLEGVPGRAREFLWSGQAEVDAASLPETR